MMMKSLIFKCSDIFTKKYILGYFFFFVTLNKTRLWNIYRWLFSQNKHAFPCRTSCDQTPLGYTVNVAAICKALGLRWTMIRIILSKWREFGIVANLPPVWSWMNYGSKSYEQTQYKQNATQALLCSPYIHTLVVWWFGDVLLHQELKVGSCSSKTASKSTSERMKNKTLSVGVT